jgi:hypothetical protein
MPAGSLLCADTSAFALACISQRTLLYQNITTHGDAFYGFGPMLEPRCIVGPKTLDQ